MEHTHTDAESIVCSVAELSSAIPSVSASRTASPVARDEHTDVWLVTGKAECEAVLANDDVFTKNTVQHADGVDFWGRRHLSVMNGSDQRRLHAMLMKVAGRAFAESLRPTVLRPITDRTVQRLVSRGSAELVAEYADFLPLAFGIACLGLEFDQATFDEFSALREGRDDWKEIMLGFRDDPDGSGRSGGRAALADMRGLMLPTIHARAANPRHDLISEFWVQGRRIFDDWSADDVLALCFTYMEGGEQKHLLRNLLWVLVSDHQLQRALLEATSPQAENLVLGFVHEGLRYLTPLVSAGDRVATEDTLVGATPIKKGEIVRPLLAQANHDSGAWPDADRFIVGRAAGADHLAFGRGRHYCAGRYLALAQAVEAISGLLRPGLAIRLDPSHEAPRWRSEFTRSASPLHVRFGP